MTKKRQKPFDAQALMRLSFLPLTAFAVLLGSCTGSARVHVAQQLCSELSEPDEACWVELTDQTGCNIQLPAPHAAYGDRAETRTWTGMCVEGLGQGTGTFKWGAPVSGNPILWKHTGHLQAGKYHGEWEEDHTFRPSAGDYVGRGSYVEGVRHGQWYEYYGKGFSDEGPYVDGKRHGFWVEMGDDRFPHIGRDRSEGSYVDGKKHGLWTITTTKTMNYDYEELEEPEIRQTQVRYVNGALVETR